MFLFGFVNFASTISIETCCLCNCCLTSFPNISYFFYSMVEIQNIRLNVPTFQWLSQISVSWLPLNLFSHCNLQPPNQQLMSASLHILRLFVWTLGILISKEWTWQSINLIKHHKRKLRVIFNSNNSAPFLRYRYSKAWTLLAIKTKLLLSEKENQSPMIICRVCATRFFQFPEIFTTNKKLWSTQRSVRLNQNMTLHLEKNRSLPSNPLLTIRIPLTYAYKHFLRSSFF